MSNARRLKIEISAICHGHREHADGPAPPSPRRQFDRCLISLWTAACGKTLRPAALIFFDNVLTAQDF
jgi:hypothetical protein